MHRTLPVINYRRHGRACQSPLSADHGHSTTARRLTFTGRVKGQGDIDNTILFRRIEGTYAQRWHGLEDALKTGWKDFGHRFLPELTSTGQVPSFGTA